MVYINHPRYGLGKIVKSTRYSSDQGNDEVFFPSICKTVSINSGWLGLNCKYIEDGLEIEAVYKKFLDKEQSQKEARMVSKFRGKMSDYYVALAELPLFRGKFNSFVGTLLYRNPCIRLEIREKVRRDFEEDYLREKGISLGEQQEGYTIIRNPDKWGEEFRLHYDGPEIESLSDFLPNYEQIERGDRIEVNNNCLCKFLLSIGFNIGTSHNVENIKNNI